MTEVKRQPKVRPEAAPISDQDVQIALAKSADPEIAIEKKPASVSGHLIEVEILRKYAPDGQPQEIKQTVPPGTVLELPKAEAVRALKLGIARATDRTFG